MISYFVICSFLIQSSFSLLKGKVQRDANIPKDETPVEIQILDAQNFEEFIKKNDYVLVKFFAPWCGHCVALEPVFLEVSKNFKNDDYPIKFVGVNCVESQMVCLQQSIPGYPVIRLYVRGEKTDYMGERSVDAISSFLTKLTNELEEIKTDQDLTLLSPKKNAVLLAMKQKNEEQLDMFRDLALLYPDVSFYVGYQDKVDFRHFAPMYEMKNTNVYAFKDYEPDVNVILSNDLITFQELVSFIRSNEVPIVLDATFQLLNDLFSRQKSMALFFYHTSKDDALALFNVYAKKHQDDTSYVKIPIDTYEFQRALDYFGIQKTEPDSLLVITKFEFDTPVKFRLDKIKVYDDIAFFFEDIKSDKIEKYYKSEEIPENNDGPVKTVVGRNFDDVVLKSRKDVILKVYSPYCVACRMFEPVFREFADLMKDNNQLIIAEYNGLLNEHRTFSPNRFPEVKFYKRGEKSNPITIEDRSLNGLKVFYEANASKVKPVEEGEEKEADSL